MPNYTPPPQCPVCSAPVTGEANRCPQCQTELSDYLSLYYAPDMLWNQAAKALARGNPRSAYDALAAAHYLRPHDLDIVLELARLAEESGDLVGAMEKMALAMQENEDPAFMEEFNRLAALQEENQRMVQNNAAAEKIMEGLQVMIDAAASNAVRKALLNP